MAEHFSREGYIVDVVSKKIFKGTVEVEGGRIVSVKAGPTRSEDYILPGLVDAHIHIESSMLVPAEFARLAAVHGTVATVSDPHEIANVLGISGVEFMIENSEAVPFKFFFGAPSCVPATAFESSGASIGPEQIRSLLGNEKIRYLSEMMNYPGVIHDDPEVAQKLEAARQAGKPVDGHAPGLSGTALRQYIMKGITTDHECFTLEEALEKIDLGMKIQIREGSAAKNFDTLLPLLRTHPDEVMFCSDDKHPDDLLLGHINDLVKRSLAAGHDLVDTLRACTYVPVRHYNLDVGLLQAGDPADLIVVDNLDAFRIKETFIGGKLVASHGQCHMEPTTSDLPNVFLAHEINETDLAVAATKKRIHVIRALEGQLITKNEEHEAKIVGDKIVSDPLRDILKIMVLNRYQVSKPAIGFIRGFGFKTGAIASTVAHDSHNIVAVGASDADLVSAVNALIKTKGGIVLSHSDTIRHLPLPVAGIMSADDGATVARQYQAINREALALGSLFSAPFMTLSFMALLVIPELKLSDKGLFDGNAFRFTSLFAE